MSLGLHVVAVLSRVRGKLHGEVTYCHGVLDFSNTSFFYKSSLDTDRHAETDEHSTWCLADVLLPSFCHLQAPGQRGT
jgi:hypothetical protein